MTAKIKKSAHRLKKAVAMPKLSARDKLLEAASRLFYSVGVHETGIDRIIAEAGVAKKTFYHHFASKNDLIKAYYEAKDVVWFERLERFTSNPNQSPLENFLSLFDGLKEWYSEPDFLGCPFIYGLSDFGDAASDKTLAECVKNHFARTQSLVEQLVKELNLKDAKELVANTMSLIAGGTIVAHSTRNPKIADINKALLRCLLK